MYSKTQRNQWQSKLRALQQQRFGKNRAQPTVRVTAKYPPPPAPPPPPVATGALSAAEFHAPWALWGVGICAAWRRLARALSDTRLPVYLTLDPFYGHARPEAAAEVMDMLRALPVSAFVGGFPTRGDAEQAAEINRLVSRPLPVALTTMIERDRIGPQSVAQANRVKQWWLPNQKNIDAFRNSGVQDFRLHKVHVPFFPNDPHLGLLGRERSPGPIHFYRIGVLDTRKDQKKSLHAFLRAFRPGEARLTLKTTHVAGSLADLWTLLADPEVRANGWTTESIRQWVRVPVEVWSEAELLALHRDGDVYLSLSHGEGWDMPAFDALLSGNRMIYSESGGPEEFAAEGDIRVKASAMLPCDPVYGWEPDAKWWDFDLDSAAAAMQEAAAHPLPKRERRSWAGFTSADVGALMRTLLEDLVSPTIARVAPRPPPRDVKKNRLAIVSLFRQCPEVVRRYRAQIESLDWAERPFVVCVEGDSTDETPDLLDAWARENDRVSVLHVSLGNPLFGSTLNPVRLKTLAHVSNVGLDFITEHLEVEYVLFLTSDLMYAPDLAKRLQRTLDERPRAGLVAPMVWRGNQFYDSWAFRRSAGHIDPLFGKGPTRDEVARFAQSPIELESVGSVLFCRAAPIYGGVRFSETDDVVGFSKNMRRAGFAIYADPAAEVHHPHEVHAVEIRGHANTALPKLAAATLHEKWTGEAPSDYVAELARTFTLRELLDAERPLEAAEVIAREKSELLIVYRPNSVPHGVASHAMFLRDAHQRASWVRSIDVARQVSDERPVKSVILQVQWGCQPTGEALGPGDIKNLEILRTRGAKIFVNYHHAETSLEWLHNMHAYRDHSDLLVFHHPEALEWAGGIYCPLPVPSFEMPFREPLGGLAFMGFADPSRRIDLLVGVAERLGVPIYGYGPRLDQISSWYETRGWRRFRPRRAFMNEAECASELARHRVALLARVATSRAYSSASARFCMAAKIPLVVDRSKSYFDLHGHVGAVVVYENKEEVDAVVRDLLEDDDKRRAALERQSAYAARHSFPNMLRAMGIE
ncbi:MAG TPA: hypothetical protein VE967_19760 [Gemmatimonadaceae bacterium]|nr:hypothetical protein [Gemmatimonadaceae bacterium]